MNQEKVKLKRGQRPIDWKNNCPKFKEYYAINNPTWTETECIDAAKKFNRQNNYRTIDYWKKRFPNATHEEHLKMRDKKLKEALMKHPQKIEYWERLFPNATHEEHLKMLSDFNSENNSQNIKFYQKRFPNATHEEHLKMLNEHYNLRLLKKQNITGKNNPNHKSNTTEYERKSRSPKCIEFYQKRFPNATHEEHLKMRDEHINKTNIIMQDKTKHVKCVDYWLAKGYSIAEAKQKISESQFTFTLEKCIKKYGLENGTKKFNERQEKWIKSFKKSMKSKVTNGIQSSNIADDLFNKIMININGKKEFILGKYAYDFVFDKKIIEFNGDYWHANPKIYDKDFINKTTGRTAKEIWSHDRSKIKYAEKHGYKVYTIWESDYKNNPTNVINKCIKFLTS